MQIEDINILDIKVDNEALNIGDIKADVEQIYPELEDLEITPSAQEQNFKSNKYGYNNVKVKEVEGEELNIIPSTEKQEYEGLYNKVNVNAIESEELNITPSTTDQVKEGLYSKVTVAGDSDLVPENIKQGANIFGVEGTAQTANIEITDTQYLFYYGGRNNCLNELINFCKNVTNATRMFDSNSFLKEAPYFDTSKVLSTEHMFNSCSGLIIIPEYDLSSDVNVYNMLRGCYNVENCGGFKNLGKGFTQKTANYLAYSLTLNSSTKYTHEALMNVINKLYDLNLTYNVANGGTLYTQSLALGSANLAKLTDEKIAIATNKRLVSFLKGGIKMKLEEKQVTLRKLVASEGKVIVSKTLDEEGNPTVKAKEIYLAVGANEDDFEEVDEM